MNLRGNLQCSKFDGDGIFSWEHFSYYDKVPPNPAGFFRNIFTPTLGYAFNWSSLVGM